MIQLRFSVVLLVCAFLSQLAHAQNQGDSPGGIIEGLAIEEIAEEGVKAAVVAGVLSGTEAQQLGEAAERIYDSPEERSDRPEDIDRDFIELLGESLKSEVEQGRMTESDGWSIYLSSVADVRSWYAQQEAEGREVTVPWSRRPSESGGLSTLQLMSADLTGDHRLKHLARPEYLRRDARYLATELRLDASMAEILDLMISDYVTSYEAAVDRLLETVERGQRREAVQTLDQSLAQIASVDIDSLDWEAIQRSNPWMQKRPGARDWVEDSLGTFQGVIGGIRKDLAEQRSELLEGGDSLTVAQCVDAVRQLRRTRATMRRVLEEQMRTLVPQGAEAQFEGLLDEMELERILNAVSLSGVQLITQHVNMSISMYFAGATSRAGGRSEGGGGIALRR